MEQREVNIMFQKAGSGSISTRIAIPKRWVDQMGITPEDRGVIVTFDGKDITIRKEEGE